MMDLIIRVVTKRTYIEQFICVNLVFHFKKNLYHFSNVERWSDG